MQVKKILLPLVALLMFIVGCNTTAATELQQKESDDQNKIVLKILNNQPLPDLNGYSFERDIVIQLLEARNKSTVLNWVYNFSPQTLEYLEICRAVGFPIPYSVQLTNPQTVVSTCRGTGNCSNDVVMQAEVNALYPPPQADATWVLCLTEDGNRVYPIYQEPHVSTFPRRIQGARKLVFEDEPLTVEIDTTVKPTAPLILLESPTPAP
jgi:hypothetical protein